MNKRRRSSTLSFNDFKKKYVNCSSSSIMQTLSTTINTAATTTTTVVDRKSNYKSYSRKWFVLATVCLLTLSNATQWMSFVSLHDASTAFYCNQDKYNFETGFLKNQSTRPLDCSVEYWTSQIFQMIGALTGIFGMYITDRYGIRISCFCGSVLNCVGAVIRVISSAPLLLPKYRFPLLLIGQTVAATSQPFFLCLSPKVAEYWFPESQRTFANALSFIANPFGVVVGSAVPVLFIDKIPKTSNTLQIFYLNLAVLTLAIIVVFMNFGIRSSHPPTPPSASSNFAHKPLFFQGLFFLLREPIFYIQTITFGMAFAIQWSFFLTADKLLTKLKYFDTITGYLLALSAFSGSIASVLAGYCVDRSKKFKETIKLCYIGMSCVAIFLNLFLRHPRETILDVFVLVVLLMALGFFSIPIFPIGLELGVETTFPVAEATSSGILCILGQFQLFIVALGMQSFESLNWFYKTNIPIENYQLSVDLWTFVTVLSTLFACLFLSPRYHRLEYEENAIFVPNNPQTS